MSFVVRNWFGYMFEISVLLYLEVEWNCQYPPVGLLNPLAVLEKHNT